MRKHRTKDDGWTIAAWLTWIFGIPVVGIAGGLWWAIAWWAAFPLLLFLFALGVVLAEKLEARAHRRWATRVKDSNPVDVLAEDVVTELERRRVRIRGAGR